MRAVWVCKRRRMVPFGCVEVGWRGSRRWPLIGRRLDDAGVAFLAGTARTIAGFVHISNAITGHWLTSWQRLAAQQSNKA